MTQTIAQTKLETHSVHQVVGNSKPKGAAVISFQSDPIYSKMHSELSCWQRFKLCCQRKTSFVHTIRTLAHSDQLPNNWESDFILALSSKDFAVHRIFLRIIVLKLPPEQLKALIARIEKETLKTLSTELLSDVLQLPPDKLKALIKSIEEAKSKTLSTELLSKFSTVVSMEEIARALQIPPEYNVQQQSKTTVESHSKLLECHHTHTHKNLPGFIRVLHSLIDTVLMAFSFFEFGKEPAGSWEASHMLSLYGQMFTFPLTMVTMLNSILLSPLQAVIITAATIAVLATILIVYVKWLKPCPEHLTLCHNLTADARDGKLHRVVMDDTLIAKMKSALSISSDDVKRSPVIIGQPGVGKSSAFEALALYLYQTGSPLTVYVVKCTKLIPTGNVYEEDKPQKILDRIGLKNKYKTVLCFEEFEAGLKNPVLNKSLLSFFDTSGESFPYCVAAITKEGFDKVIAPDNNWNDRRLRTIELGSSSEENTLLILDNMLKRNAPDLDISTQNLKAVYNVTQKFTQPDKSKVVLATAIVKMREHTTHVDNSKLLEVQKRITQIRSTITDFPSHNEYIALEKELAQKIKEEEGLDKEVKVERMKLDILNGLVKFKADQKKLLTKLAQKIATPLARHTSDSEKLFTLIYFSLLPTLQDKIKTLNPYTFAQALQDACKEEKIKTEEDRKADK